MPKTFVLISSMVFAEAWFTALKSRGCLRSFGRLVRNSFRVTNSVEAELPLYYFGNGNQTKSHFFRHFSYASSPMNSMLVKGLSTLGHHSAVYRGYAKDAIKASVELKTNSDVIRFRIGDESGEHRYLKKRNKTARQARISRKAKLNELRFYRLKAQKKMRSPNPEVRIRYKLEKAKRKEAWLIEKLRKYEMPKAPPETYDPEILTEEEKFYLKRTGEKKKHYVPVGRRGVFGGVVLNMHLHWKKHETVKVVCKPCRPGQIHTYAGELARLSKGIIIDIKPNNIIIFYRGKNYVQPDVMSPPETLSKAKALEKYRYEQSLDHTSQFIEKLEKELEEYHEHLARFRKEKSVTCKLQERNKLFRRRAQRDECCYL